MRVFTPTVAVYIKQQFMNCKWAPNNNYWLRNGAQTVKTNRHALLKVKRRCQMRYSKFVLNIMVKTKIKLLIVNLADNFYNELLHRRYTHSGKRSEKIVLFHGKLMVL